MRLVLTVLAFLLVASSAKADIDYRCVSNCTQLRNPPSYCIAQCSYQSQAQPNPAVDVNHGTDYKCMSQCIGNGYQYGYCQTRCTH